jgi:L-alanine-DL-glutamate epimerase-like enolase superfamily enzyme
VREDACARTGQACSIYRLMLTPAPVRLVSLAVAPLSVPLYEPFVIATGRIDTTRAALVSVTLEDPASGQRAQGIGEAAALPNVTHEDQPELLAALSRLAQRHAGASGPHWSNLADLGPWLDAELSGLPVARAGLECAVLDAWSRLLGVPLYALLRGDRETQPITLETDITLPIAEPSHMADLAAGYRARGFRAFKVKVGKDLEHDVDALLRVHERVRDASFLLDANAGFSAEQALELVTRARDAGLRLACFEQPCARDDLAGMARVTAEAGLPVIADESVRNHDDLARVVRARAAHGINLKLVKSGGPLAAFALAQAARAHGMSLMCGGMVETRLGMSAMAHVVCALGGVDFVDLDTAFLLAEERFDGGYVDQGALLSLTRAPGLGVVLASEWQASAG